MKKALRLATSAFLSGRALTIGETGNLFLENYIEKARRYAMWQNFEDRRKEYINLSTNQRGWLGLWKARFHDVGLQIRREYQSGNIAIGSNAHIIGQQSIAIGRSCATGANDTNIAIGSASYATGAYSIAIGRRL